MKTSDNGIALVKAFEGLETKAYPDPATGGAPWTIGYGHTGNDVRPGTVWNQAQAESVLRTDLAYFESLVSNALTTTVNQNQFDALVSFCFNVGPGKKGVKDGLLVLKNGNPSSLLRLTNARDFDGAARQFKYWCNAAGKPMKGLIRRRAAEAALYSGATASDAIAIGKAAA
ncbi:lysozyme [Pantoea ananatis]|uniref:lysozyme n=1 Tax=Pantoea ananas TaxID=553 RepID=UPI001B317D71|nr:lysozyme [Pantoea ananatis]